MVLRILCASILLLSLTSAASLVRDYATPSTMPYREAGLSTRQAAEHLLSRFTWGARPEDIDRVERMGLDAWFESQLNAKDNEADVENRLSSLKTLHMNMEEIARLYPPPGKVIVELMREGILKNIPATGDTASKETRRAVLKYAYENGYHPQKELLAELFAQKLIRARYSEQQVADVMSDFWFNHFCVSAVKTPARNAIMCYERDAIRPNALGNFSQLVLATAQHPAMLQYLDNAQSTAPEGTPTLLSTYLDSLKDMPGLRGWIARRKIAASEKRTKEYKEQALAGLPEEFKPRRGINENYARELLELHTMGVDGGYTQHDVTDCARILSGWSMMPYGLGKNRERVFEMIEKTKAAGTVVQGDFLFRADGHDVTPKTFLGHEFPAGHGMDEGLRLMKVVCEHPSTAHHIAEKLCRRFVCDTPSTALVDRTAKVFKDNHGDIKSMLRAIVQSPEFWSADVRRAKIKSPFHLLISAARAMNADLGVSKPLYDWLGRMGQALYAAPAPTGFDDRATRWVNAASLVARMNFGIDASLNKIKAFSVQPQRWESSVEDGSTTEAARRLFLMLMPERDPAPTLRLLQNQLRASDEGRTHDSMHSPTQSSTDFMNDDELISDTDFDQVMGSKTSSSVNNHGSVVTSHANSQNLTARLVGILIGSPEFQRY